MGERRQGEKGSVTLEATFFLVFFVLAFFAAVELGRALSVKHSMDVGVYRAARYLSIDPSDTATAEGMIRDEVDNNLLGGGYGDLVRVMVEMPSAYFGATFTVRAEVDYQATIPFLPLPLRTIVAVHSQNVERFP